MKQYNARVRSEFEQALGYHIVIAKSVDENTSNRYAIVTTEPFDLSAKLAAYDMRLTSSTPNLGEVKRAVIELKRLQSEGLPRVDVKDIFGSINEDMAKENLVRSPQLIARVREELAKMNAITAKVAELESILAQYQDEEQWYDRFIEALYTDTIVKKGALYVYDRDAEEDAWEPFANLMKSRNYAEYEVFGNFRALSEKDRSTLLRKASRRDNELTASEDITPLLSKLDDLAALYMESRDRLEYERVELANGEDIYQFYRTLSSKLNDIRRRLK